MAAPIKGMATKDTKPAARPAKPDEVTEEPAEHEMTDDERRLAREAHLRMWPLEEHEKR